VTVGRQDTFTNNQKTRMRRANIDPGQKDSRASFE
jgi:hypothetical protein